MIMSPLPSYRLGTESDLPALESLEAECFEPSHRETRAVLRRALTSAHQEVWLRREAPAHAALILRIHPHSLKLFSIAVHPAARGRGWGEEMLALTVTRARALQRRRIRLEAAANDTRLIEWYERAGYVRRERLLEYYGPDDDAWRMERLVK